MAKIPTPTLDDYAHSPFHYAVVSRDHSGLIHLVSSLPKLTEPDQIQTESDSLSQERVAEIISAIIDCRDVPFRETPLHLAVRLGDIFAAKTLSSAGADPAFQNVFGWNALQEAFHRGNAEMTEMILRHHWRSGWCRWRRRLPHLVAALGRAQDFYAEMSIGFESSVVPFFGKVAPSDTYKIWKRGGSIRADASLTGFNRFKFKIRRAKANRSFLFLSSDDDDDVSSGGPGTLLVLNREEKTVSNAFEEGVSSEREMDVARAELVEMKSWRGNEKVETVGEWRAKGYEVKNVSFGSKSRKAVGGGETEQMQNSLSDKRNGRSLSPAVWLANDYPLKTEELLALLDVLAIDVEAVRRMRELLAVKLPAGTFPVKMSIPVSPTVKAVITFSKFVGLPPMDQFYTPVSSPRHISAGVEDQCNVESDIRTSTSRRSFSTPSWLRLKSTKKKGSQRRLKKEQAQMVDPFAIPAEYKWTTNSDRSVIM